MLDFNSEITERHLGLLWGKKNYKLPFQRSPKSLSTRHSQYSYIHFCSFGNCNTCSLKNETQSLWKLKVD